MYLALGTNISEFRCLPEELLTRLDRYPDAVGQVREIFDHYGRVHKRQEDDRLWKDVQKAKGPPINDEVLVEVNRELDRRAEKRGTTPDEELDRLTRKYKD